MADLRTIAMVFLLMLYFPRESDSNLLSQISSVSNPAELKGSTIQALLSSLPSKPNSGHVPSNVEIVVQKPSASDLILKVLKLTLLFKASLLGFLAPLKLVALRELLLKPLVGKLLLQLPLILTPGPGFDLRLLAVKAALAFHGLKGIKGAIMVLLLGAAAMRSGTKLGLANSSNLKQLNHLPVQGISYLPLVYKHPGALHVVPTVSYGVPSPFQKPFKALISSHGPAKAFHKAPGPFPGPTKVPHWDPRPSQGSRPVYRAPGTSHVLPAVLYGFPRPQISSQRLPNPLYNSHVVSQGFPSTLKSLPTSSVGKLDSQKLGEPGLPVESSSSPLQTKGRTKRNAMVDEADGQLSAFQNGQAYLDLAADMDQRGCGRRILCEIYQKPDSALTAEEILLKNMFGKTLRPLPKEDEGTAKALFYQAAWLGQVSPHRPEVCAGRFALCPYSSDRLLRSLFN